MNRAVLPSLFLVAACGSKAPRPAPAVAAEPAPVAIAPTERLLLPLSGLFIDVPVLENGATYTIAGSWALGADDNYYGRDVIEEHSAAGALLAGTWALIGYYEGRACADLFGDDEVITWSWPLETRTLDGTSWVLRGGTAEIVGLEKMPAIRGCVGGADELKMLVYRFFAGEPATMSADEMIAAFTSSPVVAALDDFFGARARAAVEPTRDPAVINIGELAAARDVVLTNSGLTITLPDDGFVWRNAQPTPDGVIDDIARAAPAIPEVDLQVRRQPRSCADQLADFAPSNLTPAHGTSEAWIVGPAIQDSLGVGHIVCHDYRGGSLLVGAFGTDGDLTRFQPMLDALARAVD